MEYIGDAIELRCLRRGQPDPCCTLSGHFCSGEAAANRVTRDQHALMHSVDGFAKAAADLPDQSRGLASHVDRSMARRVRVCHPSPSLEVPWLLQLTGTCEAPSARWRRAFRRQRLARTDSEGQMPDLEYFRQR